MATQARVFHDGVHWDGAFEHADEAAYLFSRMARAQQSARLRWPEVESWIEPRLFAQLDALVVHGPELATKLPAALLQVATWVWIEHGCDDLILRTLIRTDSAGAAAIGAALAHSVHSEVDTWVARWIAGDVSQRVRTQLLHVIAVRGVAPELDLRVSLVSTNAEEATAAALAARWADPTLHLPVLERLLQSGEPLTAAAARASALVLGSQAALDHALRAAADVQTLDAEAFLICALFGSPRDQHVLLAQLARTKHRESALFALGFCGRSEIAPVLLSYLDAPSLRTRRLAAEALATLSGIHLDEHLATADDDPPVENFAWHPVDELPRPDAASLREAWLDVAAASGTATALLLGEPWTPERALAALTRLPMRSRHPVALGLLVRSRGQAYVDTSAFSPTQHAQIARIRRLGLAEAKTA